MLVSVQLNIVIVGALLMLRVIERINANSLGSQLVD